MFISPDTPKPVVNPTPWRVGGSVGKDTFYGFVTVYDDSEDGDGGEGHRGHLLGLMAETAAQKAIAAVNEVEKLRAEVKRLKKQVGQRDDELHAKNMALDALHYVWCDGYCASGVHRYTDETFTEEVVLQAELQAQRLRRKFNAMSWAVRNWPAASQWHDQHVKRLKRKLGYPVEE